MLTPALLLAAAVTQPADPIPILLGTYTGGESRGIYRTTLDPATGNLSEPTLAADVDSPSFLAASPDGRCVYAVSEAFGGGRADGVTAFRVTDDGTLDRLNARPSVPTGAKAGAAHVSVTPDGKVVLSANYGGGNVAAFPVNDDGSLGEFGGFVQHAGSSVNPKRQEGPHAHAFTPAPGGRFAVVPDLGLDKLFVYAVDPDTAELTEHSVLATPPGGGPRHIAFTPDGRFAFACLEMGERAAGPRLGRGRRHAVGPGGAVDAAGRVRREEHDGGGPRPPGRPVRLRLQPRARQRRGVPDRSQRRPRDCRDRTGDGPGAAGDEPHPGRPLSDRLRSEIERRGELPRRP